MNLIIDPEFRDKIPTLSEDEFQKLRENILSDGEVRDPLVVWGETIIDGHHRWRIIQEHPELHYTIKRMEFPDKWAAIAWMCRNQLGRRNLTDEQKTYLIGKQYEAQKMTQGASDGFRGNQHIEVSHQIGDLPKGKTKDIIAKEHGIGGTTVERAEQFAHGLDAADEASPGIKDAILSGEVKAPKSMIAEIRNLSDEKKKEVAEAIKQGDTDTAKYIMRPSHVPQEPEAERAPLSVEQFRELLDCVAKDIDDGFRLHMVSTHRDLLNNKEYRDAAKEAMLGCIKVIEKYQNMVRMIEEDAE